MTAEPARDTTNDIALTEPEIHALRMALRQWLPISYEGGVALLVPAVERIIADRLAAHTSHQQAALAAVEKLADKWNGTPDYNPSDYDQGRVDQRHAMTTELYEVLATNPDQERAQ